ncbi:UPF0261 protein [Lasiodiplodia hormozganensis]|uniref:UPF0261 protein n=1 Tax=Lasiodiplodia hormozganensis TaxID=869390 RepID=A0AA40CK06_9PEZI|nr:UPF0261 protein [Lasiodiplodia hormozganensis]
MPRIILLGTCDTKLEELLYTRERILAHKDTTVTLIDVGRESVSNNAITVPSNELTAKYAPDGAPTDISALDRGQLNKHMAACATNYIRELLERQQGDSATTTESVTAVLGLGGSGGTSLAAAVMREAFPMGFPKLIVSTIASGETGPIVGETDITLMYSIVDIAGLNTILRTVLSNAAGAIVGMAHAYLKTLEDRAAGTNNDPNSNDKKIPIRLGITMFGVTTPAVTAIRQYLSQLSAAPPSACPYTFPDTHVFHATGHGGLAYERLVRAGALDAAIDLTTTELADHLIAGTNMSAGPTRLSAAATGAPSAATATAAPNHQHGNNNGSGGGSGAASGTTTTTTIPHIVSLGATDMANFGPRATAVPDAYVRAGRTLYEHNPSVTLMRTSPDECARIGEHIAAQLRRAKDPRKIQVWVPRGGVSLMSVAGGPFEDREADKALFKAVREGLEGSGVRVVEDERAINEEGFARAVVDALVGLLGVKKE